jgi:integrase
MQWIKTKFPGIRYREHSKRKHGIQPDRYYVATYWLNGKTKSEVIGWLSEGFTLEIANERLSEIKRNQRTGDGPVTLTEKKILAEEKKAALEAEKKRIEEERIAAEQAESELKQLEHECLVDVVFKRYCDSNSHKKSMKDEITLMRLWVNPVIKGKRLQEITSFDIERIKRNMLKAGRAVRTVQYTFAVIRQLFNYSKRIGLFHGECPTKGVKIQKVDNRRMRFLSPDEANKLLDEIKKHSAVSYRISLLSLYSGMRFGEIANLKWQTIDLEHKQITILDPKNGNTRTAFMAEAVYQMFSEMSPGKANDLIFATKEGIPMKQVSDSFMDAVNALKLNDGIEDRRMKVVFHSLRHSCASHLAMSGADLSTVQAVLGHKTIAMTERYSHLTNHHIKSAIDRLNDAMTPKRDAEVIPMAGRAG